MTDAYGQDAAHPISWSAPNYESTIPVWSGPRAHETQAQPQGGQWGAGWPSSGQGAPSAPPQQQYDQHQQYNDRQNVGWMPPSQGSSPSGASRLDAYEGSQSGYAPNAYQQPSSYAQPGPYSSEPSGHGYSSYDPAFSGPRGYAAQAPNSYAAAPSGGNTGMRSGYPSSPQGERPYEAPASYASAPPEVIGQHDDLPEDALSIGRSRTNSIVLDDMLVSRRHVIITADEEGLLLRDLGSRNGTFVNGRRVEQTHLHEGDKIGIGASTFEVRDGWLVSV